MRNRCVPFLPVILLLLAPASALAATYEVGPGKPYAALQEVLDKLGPGDVVEVQGDQTYAGDVWFRPENGGTADAPVTVRGILVNGRVGQVDRLENALSFGQQEAILKEMETRLGKQEAKIEADTHAVKNERTLLDAEKAEFEKAAADFEAQVKAFETKRKNFQEQMNKLLAG